MARPQIIIDKDEFEKLCGLQCTLDEVAGWFKCSPDTVERWCKRTYKQTFQEVYKMLAMAGRISLRRSQFKLAGKNASMAIFLGKNYLGQSDVQRLDIHKDDDETIENMKEYFASQKNGGAGVDKG